MHPVRPRPTRSFVALLASVFCSSAAAGVLVTVLGKQVYDLTGSALDLGLLGLAEFAPAAVLVFVTGTLADRVDRRRLAGAGLVLQALSVAVLAWYAGTQPTSTVPIFLLVIAFGTAGRVHDPRRSARSRPTSSRPIACRGSWRARPPRGRARPSSDR